MSQDLVREKAMRAQKWRVGKEIRIHNARFPWYATGPGGPKFWFMSHRAAMNCAYVSARYGVGR